jgi:TP901 family phage tail tape measure protein
MPFSSSGNQELAVEITASDNGASEAFDGVASSASGVKTAVLGASGVLAGAGVAALAKATQAAATFEQAMVDVEKVTNPEIAEEMSQSVREMATEIPMAQEKLAGLAADAARFGIEGPEAITAFTESVAKMATATELNAQEAGESLAKLAELTNTPVSEIENLGSAINALSNNFATSSQEIVDGMLRSSAALSQLGLEQTEIAGISAALNEVSDSSERAGTRMRRLAQELMDPKKSEELAGALGMTTDEFETMRKNSPKELMLSMAEAMKAGGDRADALRSALSTTSRQALGGLASNLEGTRDALETSNTSYEEATSLQKEFNAQTDTFNSQLKLVANQLQNVAITMGNQILPVLTKGLKTLRPLISSFATFNKRLDGMPALITAITATITGLTGVVYALGISITGALLPAIAVIGALAAAGYALYTAWQSNFAGIRDVVTNTIDIVQQTFKRNRAEFEAVEASLRSLWNQFTVAMTNVEAILRFALENYAIPLVKRLREVWKQNFAEIATEVSTTMAFLLKRVKTAGKRISVFWNKYGDEIMTITKTVFDFLVLTIGTAMDAILTGIKVVLALIRGDWKQAFTYIGDFFTRTFDELLSFLGGSFLKGLGAVMSLIVSAITAPFEAIYNTLIGNSIVPETFNEILAFLRGNFLVGARNLLGRVHDAFTSAFTNISSTVQSTIADLVSSVMRSVGSLRSRMVDEMRAAVDDMKRAFNGAIPDTLSIPSVTVGGGDIDIPGTNNDIDIPSETLGGQSLDLPHLAEGGIVDSKTIAMIGEAGNEAVVPLDRLAGYLDTAYETGTQTAVESTTGSPSGSNDSSLTARLRVEGDGVLAELIREEAALVVDENDRDKRNRLSRLS